MRPPQEVLEDTGVVRASGDDYGAVCLPTDATRQNWDVAADIIDLLDQP